MIYLFFVANNEKSIGFREIFIFFIEKFHCWLLFGGYNRQEKENEQEKKTNPIPLSFIKLHMLNV